MDFPVIKGEDVFWDGLKATIYFNKDLDGKLENELNEMIDAWIDVGLKGGFKGHIHNLMGFWCEENVAEITVDMGSSEPIALEVLFNMLTSFLEENDLKVEKVVIGD
jgi:hypothetical protein